MNRAIHFLAALISLSTATLADLPYLDIASDVQRPDVQFDIKRVFSGNTPMIRWTVTDGYATNAADLTNWTYTLWYGWDNSATSGTAVAQYNKTNNVVRFYALTNFYAIPNDNYYVSIVGTHTSGAVRTWATGKMNQRWDFAANSPSSVPVEPMPWNWNLIGPYSGTWPFIAGANVTLSGTPTGLVITASSGNATNGLNGVTLLERTTNGASLATNWLTLAVRTNFASVTEATNKAPASTTGYLPPIFGPPGTVSSVDGNGNAVNETFWRTSIYGYNRSYAIFGLYASVGGQAIGSSPPAGLDLWTIDNTNDPFSARSSPFVAYGMHSATSAVYHGKIFTRARGTNNYASDLVFEVVSPDPLTLTTVERMRITTEGNVIVSNTVQAGAFVGGGGSITGLNLSAYAGTGLAWNGSALVVTQAAVTSGAWNASVAGASNLALGAYALATNALPMTGGTVTGNLRVTAGVTAATVTATGRLGGNGISLTNTAVVSVTRYAADADGAVVDAWRAGTNFVWFAMQPTNFAGLRIGGPESYTADFTNYTIWIWGTNLQVNGRITGDGSALSGISAGSVTLTSNVVWKVPAMRGFWDISSDVPTNGGASLAFEAPFPTSTVLRASLRTLWTGGAVRVAQGAVMALSSVATNRASVHVDYIAWTNVVTNSVWFTALGSTNALGTTALTTTGVYIVSATNFSGERALIPYFKGTQTGLGATNWGRSFLPNLGEVEQ